MSAPFYNGSQNLTVLQSDSLIPDPPDNNSHVVYADYTGTCYPASLTAAVTAATGLYIQPDGATQALSGSTVTSLSNTDGLINVSTAVGAVVINVQNPSLSNKVLCLPGTLAPPAWDSVTQAMCSDSGGLGTGGSCVHANLTLSSLTAGTASAGTIVLADTNKRLVSQAAGSVSTVLTTASDGALGWTTVTPAMIAAYATNRSAIITDGSGKTTAASFGFSTSKGKALVERYSVNPLSPQNAEWQPITNELVPYVDGNLGVYDTDQFPAFVPATTGKLTIRLNPNPNITTLNISGFPYGLKMSGMGTWKSVYLDSASILTGVSLGSANTTLVSNGTSAAPTYQAIVNSLANGTNTTVSAATGTSCAVNLVATPTVTSIKFNTALGPTQSALGNYAEVNVTGDTTNWYWYPSAGAVNKRAGSLYFVRVGNMVTLTIPTTLMQNSSAGAVFLYNKLPTGLIPARDQDFWAPVDNGAGALVQGRIRVQNNLGNGSLLICVFWSTGFTTGTWNVIGSPFSLTYSLS
jgi:hypothetical protein